MPQRGKDENGQSYRSFAGDGGIPKSRRPLKSNPEADPFVKVGDTVSAGQTILIIEAMKVMNQIAASKAGTVRAILVENGQAVEFDQPLIVVE